MKRNSALLGIIFIVGLWLFACTEAVTPKITSYSINGIEGIIDEELSEIIIPLEEDPGYDKTKLIPEFVYTGSLISVSDIQQESGKTSLDFSDTVVYTVSDGDVLRTYRVSVYLTGKTKLLFSEYFNYEEGGDEDDDEKLGSFTQYSVEGVSKWAWSDAGGKEEYVSITGYYDRAVNNDWLIMRKALDLSDYSAAYLQFDSAMNYDTATSNVTVRASKDYQGSGNPEDSNWTDLSSHAQWAPEGWVFTPSGAISLEDFVGGPMYIAFQFINTSTTESDTWEIDDIEITGEK